jgi:hypothetical protein
MKKVKKRPYEDLGQRIADQLGIEVKTIQIKLTEADRKRHKELNRFLLKMEEAHRQAGKSKLRFGDPSSFPSTWNMRIPPKLSA